MRAFYFAIAFMLSALAAAAQYPYKLIVPVHDARDGDTACIYNHDNDQMLLSTQVEHETAVFTGEIDEPIAIDIYCNGQHYTTCILEQGTTAYSPKKREAVGSMLNDQYNDYKQQISSINRDLEKASSQGARNQLLLKKKQLRQQLIDDNIDNALGYLVLLELAQDHGKQIVIEYIDDNPELLDYKRLAAIKRQHHQ